MEGIINEGGILKIKRGGKMATQMCPFAEGEARCGDWCPLFGNPIISKWIGSPDPDMKDREWNPKHWYLQICHTLLYFDELVDQR